MKIGRVDKDLRAEVRAYARGWRWFGLSLLTVSLAMLVWPRLTGEWPMIGDYALQDIGWVLLALAWTVMIAVILFRSRFYRRRLEELGKR